MKKIISPILITLLLVFSFIYTNKTIEILKEKDPIMQEIKKSEEKYKIEPIDAQIIGNNIISGKNGQTIDYEETYTKMKHYGTYNESLTTLKEIKPTITLDNNYDKYVVSGSKYNKNIALIFKLAKDKDMTKILNILKKKEVPVTIFIDGTLLESNLSMIKTLTEHQLEILSYNDDYNKQLFKSSISYLNSITKKEAKYCYTEISNDDLLSLCKELKFHTIKPTIILEKDIYKEVKEKISNSIIITLPINTTVEKELATTIDYIKSKGYNLVTIDKLLDEKY